MVVSITGLVCRCCHGHGSLTDLTPVFVVTQCLLSLCVCVCVCVCVCARARVRACVCVCARARASVRLCVGRWNAQHTAVCRKSKLSRRRVDLACIRKVKRAGRSPNPETKRKRSVFDSRIDWKPVQRRKMRCKVVGP